MPNFALTQRNQALVDPRSLQNRAKFDPRIAAQQAPAAAPPTLLPARPLGTAQSPFGVINHPLQFERPAAPSGKQGQPPPLTQQAPSGKQGQPPPFMQSQFGFGGQPFRSIQPVQQPSFKGGQPFQQQNFAPPPLTRLGFK